MINESNRYTVTENLKDWGEMNETLVGLYGIFFEAKQVANQVGEGKVRSIWDNKLCFTVYTTETGD